MQIPVTLVNAAGGGAMTQLYDNIASGAIASWNVTGISQAYNHLQVFIYARGDTAATNTVAKINFNNDSGANYDDQSIVGNAAVVAAGETIAATSARVAYVAASTATAGSVGSFVSYIPNYAGTTFHKNFASTGTWTSTSVSAGFTADVLSGRWRSTAAINQITITPAAGNFVAGSRLTIYGLL